MYLRIKPETMAHEDEHSIAHALVNYEKKTIQGDPSKTGHKTLGFCM